MDMIIDQQVSLDEALVPHVSRLRIGKSNFHLRSDITSKESTLQLATMDMIIDQQVALDEALVPHVSRLRIGKSNFHLRSDITSKESTLQLVYDVPRLTPFYKAFLVTADVPKIYISFAAVINKCLSGKSTGYNSLWLSQAQILWGMYHKKNVDFAYLLWEDFVYQVEHKDAKKSNEMYYPKFTKVIIHFFMTKDPLIPRRNKVNWHYVRDDQMFTTIKLVSRHQNTQQFSPILPVELTNKDIRNSAAYKEYYAIASGAAPPKTKATKGKQPAKLSKAKGLSVLSDVAMTEAKQMKLATKRSLQQTHISQAIRSGADEGTGIIPGFLDVPTDESDKEISWKSSDEDDDDDVDDQSDADDDTDDQDDNDDDQDTDNNENSDDEGNDDVSLEGRDAQMTDVHITQEFKDTHVTLTLVNLDGQQHSSSMSSQFVTSMLNPSPDAGIVSLFKSTPRFAGAVSFILEIIERCIDQRINEPVKVKVQVSKILLKIKKTVNEQLEAEVLTRSSNSSKISYAVVADLSKLELKKILIKKMESNKSIHQSDQQRNLYKAMMDAYKCDKIILDTYGDSVTEGKEPESTRTLKEKATKTTGKSTEGSKSHQNAASESAPTEEPMQTTQDLEEPSHQEFETGAADDQLIAKASQHPEWFQKQKKPPTPDPFLINRLKVDTLTPKLLAGLTDELMKGSCKSLVELEFFLEEVYKATTDQLDWNNPKGKQYLHNLLKPLPLIPNSQGHRVIPFDHFINNDLEYLRGGASSSKYTTSVTKTKVANYGHIKWIEDLVPRIMWSQEPISYDKYALWGISHWGRKRQQFNGFVVNRESITPYVLGSLTMSITQAKNEDFLNKIDENIQKIIYEQVKVQVSKILPKIEKTVNEQLEAKVMTRSSNSSKTSYVVAADLSGAKEDSN
uniref:Uncharacterized protein n=1 Tax=Tanacetum cinerariifolium TaxID=118510 RepID=A0A6L2NB45_TANCI|nr:hypothetical protein [Tanacetum cinerariifolium]